MGRKRTRKGAESSGVDGNKEKLLPSNFSPLRSIGPILSFPGPTFVGCPNL